MFTALDPLVRDGTLTPEQAGRVYSAVRPVSTSGTPAGLLGQWSLRDRAIAAVAVIGGALAVAGLLVAASLASSRGFEWKTFVVMLVAVAVLLGGAAVAEVLLPKGSASRWLAAVLLTLGIIGTGSSILAMWGDTSGIDYLAGLLMLAGGVAGYYLLRAPVVTTAAAFGAVVLFVSLVSDLVGDGSGEHTALKIGIGGVVLGAAVLAVGWPFGCRNVTGMLGGVIALVSMAFTFTLSLVFALSSAVSSGLQGGSRSPLATSDLKIAAIIGLVVAAALGAAFVYSRFVGFAVLAVLGAALFGLLGTIAFHDHPLRWGGALLVIGALGIAASLAGGLTGRSRTSPGGAPFGNAPGYSGSGYPDQTYPQSGPGGYNSPPATGPGTTAPPTVTGAPPPYGSSPPEPPPYQQQ